LFYEVRRDLSLRIHSESSHLFIRYNICELPGHIKKKKKNTINTINDVCHNYRHVFLRLIKQCARRAADTRNFPCNHAVAKEVVNITLNGPRGQYNFPRI
jgi:hypothetical protein